MYNKNVKNALLVLSLVVNASLLCSCSSTPTNTPDTEIQSIGMTVDQVYENVKESVPAKEKPDETMIEEALLKHYDENFGHTEADIKSFGYKIYLVEDSAPGQKKAYGYANYMEYKINEDGSVNNTAGSGAAPVSITIDKKKDTTFVYEIYTDDELQGKSFTKNFAESVRDKILERNQADIDELVNMQKTMAKEIYESKTGKTIDMNNF